MISKNSFSSVSVLFPWYSRNTEHLIKIMMNQFTDFNFQNILFYVYICVAIERTTYIYVSLDLAGQFHYNLVTCYTDNEQDGTDQSPYL